jgi:hypothetical protein
MAINSKAGLIGYYEGTISSTLHTLQNLPEDKKDLVIQALITTLEGVLQEGEEAWQRVKGQ